MLLPVIQALIVKGYGARAILWTLNMFYCRELSLLEGRLLGVSEQLKTFAALTDSERGDAIGCSMELSSKLADMQAEGCSPLAMAYALIGALLRLNDGLPVPVEDKERYQTTLIQALHNVSKTMVN